MSPDKVLLARPAGFWRGPQRHPVEHEVEQGGIIEPCQVVGPQNRSYEPVAVGRGAILRVLKLARPIAGLAGSEQI